MDKLDHSIIVLNLNDVAFSIDLINLDNNRAAHSSSLGYKIILNRATRFFEQSKFVKISPFSSIKQI
jgi:hypothetical protein